MDKRFLRSEMLFGGSSTEILSKKKVAVFGVGGVGGYVVEALARAGIGGIDIIDKDTVDITNINRQIIALETTLGQPKVEVIKKRILDINPECKVSAYNTFFLPQNAVTFDFSGYDYIVDAVDTVTAKLTIIEYAKKNNIPVISSMGTGNKLDPTRFCVTDIYKTNIDPLARIMRNECRKRGIDSLKVVCSNEKPIVITENINTPASNSFVPPVAGFIIAGEVIKELLRG
ncbi:MAG: tRNA threonylcarbamoyladenosine dehydratase [Clostridia bacterium]|nr:tRNA threonylcarbamoyladenosine dehydratase [Clostridia bacterium]